jgi:hypothetical protein
MFEPIGVSLFEDVSDYYYFQANVNYKYSYYSRRNLCQNFMIFWYVVRVQY